MIRALSIGIWERLRALDHGGGSGSHYSTGSIRTLSIGIWERLRGL